MEKSRINSTLSIETTATADEKFESTTFLSTPSVQLRPLPGYSVQRPISEPISTSQNDIQSAPTATKYQNRERLYYETDTEIVKNKATSRPQAIIDRLAEDAPPATSLLEFGSLTPEQKYASSKYELSEGDKSKNHASPGTPYQKLVIIEEAPIATEGNWVTVFGFVGTQTNTILEYFKKLGVIEQYEIGQGNWIHIKYSTLWAAQKALAKNGSVLTIAGTCMIGVVPTQRAMDQVTQTSDSFMSPIKKEAINNKSNVTSSETTDIFIKPGLMMSPLLTNTRPSKTTNTLGSTTAAGTILQTPTAATRITDPLANAPPPSVMSKALSYVLGW